MSTALQVQKVWVHVYQRNKYKRHKLGPGDIKISYHDNHEVNITIINIIVISAELTVTVLQTL